MNIERFLRKIKVWTKYQKNLYKHRIDLKKAHYPMNMLDETPPVEQAFDWDKTFENREFWQNIYDRQKELIFKIFKEQKRKLNA